MTPERFERIKAALAKRQPDLTVLLDGVNKPHNLAAIRRSCDAMGVFHMHAVAPKGITRRRPKASAGTHRWVGVTRHDSTEEAFTDLRQQGFKLVIAHPTDNSTSFTEYDFCQPTAVVFGTELQGLSDYSIQHADAAIHIPMLGLSQSLNVSVSAALILYQAMTQRERAGLYNKPRIDDTTYTKTLFEWTWPQIAHYCRERNIPYPEFDVESGEILSELPGTATMPMS